MKVYCSIGSNAIRTDNLRKVTQYFKDTARDIYTNGVSKSIVHVIKHANFQFYRAYLEWVIWKNW